MAIRKGRAPILNARTIVGGTAGNVPKHLGAYRRIDHHAYASNGIRFAQ